jgi:hypothetical protein
MKLQIKREYEKDWIQLIWGFGLAILPLGILVTFLITKNYIDWSYYLISAGLTFFGIKLIVDYFKDKKKFEIEEINVLSYKEMR